MENTEELKQIPNELPPFYVGAILLGTSGDLLLQLRDDIPGIVHPGKVGTFGGGGETGETPVEAIIREVKEEINVDLSPDDLFLLYEGQTKFEGNIVRNSTMFGAFDIPEDNLIITEGRLLRLKPQDFPIDNMTPGTRRAVPIFLEECSRRGVL